MAVVMKSAKCMSTTGRAPQRAAPTAAPTIDVSEIGVSRTRPTPNSSGRPLNWPKTPPWRAMSSPMTKTSGSRRISSRIAARVASVKVSSGIRRGEVQILERLLRARKGALAGEANGGFDLVGGLAAEVIQVVRAEGAVVEERPLEATDRVALAPGLDLAGLTVELGVADVVAAHAVGLGLDQGRAAAGAGALGPGANRLVDPHGVVAVDDQAGHAVAGG